MISFSLLNWFNDYMIIDHAEDERAFDYESDGIKGPTHWGELRPEWHACKAGLMQSPIDMLHERVEVISHLGDLKINYKPSNATLKNRGHDMMVINNEKL